MQLSSDANAVLCAVYLSLDINEILHGSPTCQSPFHDQELSSDSGEDLLCSRNGLLNVLLGMCQRSEACLILGRRQVDALAMQSIKNNLSLLVNFTPRVF